MAVCQVCGCKTDELDFVDGRIGNLEKKVCSFCGRQLKNIDGESITDAQAKWLSAVASKDVPEREADVSEALKDILKKHNAGVEISAPQESAEPQVKFYKAKDAGKKAVAESDKDEQIAELTARVEKLEKMLIAMKRSQLIKLLCEIAIPVILGIVILIIFFSSGFYQTLSDLYSSFS